MAEATKFIHHLGEESFYLGDGTLPSNISYLTAFLDKHGNEESRRIVREIQGQIESFQSTGVPVGSDVGAIPDQERRVLQLQDALRRSEAMLKEITSQALRNRTLALSMGEAMKNAGLTPPPGLSALIQE